MKKIMCVLLSVVLSLSCCVCAFAAEDSAEVFGEAEQTVPFILIRGMDLQGVYVDVGTENERRAMGEITVGGVIGTLAQAMLVGTLGYVLGNYMGTITAIALGL